MDYRECLAENSDNQELKDAVEKEKENFNALKERGEGQGEEYSELTEGGSFWKSIFSNLFKWITDFFQRILNLIKEALNNVPV